MAYNRISLDGLTARLAERCGNNTTFWTAPERADAVNEALCVWQAATGATTISASIPVGAGGSAFFAVPKQMMSVQVVKWAQSSEFGRIPNTLTMTSIPELDYGFGNWESVTGTPELWAPNGLNEIALYPVPTTGVVLLKGIADRVRLNASDFFDSSDDEITPVVSYGHHYCTFKEAGAEQQSSQEELKEFLNAAAERNGKLRVTAFYAKMMGLQREEGERPARSAGGLGVRV